MRSSNLLPALGLLLLSLSLHAAPPPDPATHRDHHCLYTANYTWNDGSGTGNVAGKVYRPGVLQSGRCNSGWPAGTLPLVVLAHGNGFLHTSYEHLAKHLAYNGFVVASVNTGNLTDARDRAAKLITYTHGMFHFYAQRARLSGDVALVGHSRGGEAVVRMAIDSLAQNRPWTVEAVVSLAPTDAGQPADLYLTWDAAKAYLALVASQDSDVSGRCVGDNTLCSAAQPSRRPGTGLTLYDRAGGWSRSATTPTQWMTKALVFLHGAGHPCFGDVLPNQPQSMGCAVQKEATRGYVNAFLRWRLLGDAGYRAVFSGEWTLPTVQANGERVTAQFQELGPRVLDDFENGSWATNALGGSLAVNGVSVQETMLFQYDSVAPVGTRHYTIPHQSRGLAVTWSGSPWVLRNAVWAVPSSYRNVGGFAVLSLRAAKLYASQRNPAGTLGLLVTLRDSAGRTASVDVATLGGLAEPEHVMLSPPTQNLGGQPGNFSKSALRTIRIPLASFGGVDLTRVSQVSIGFPGGSGEVILDDLAFSH